MSVRSTLIGLCGLVSLSAFAAGCQEGLPDGADSAPQLASAAQALSAHGQSALDWANGWISEVKASPSQLAENVYTTSSPSLERMNGVTKAKNRSVCGTLITQLFQKSIGLSSNDFYKSFNKDMDGTCDVGTLGADTMNPVQKGTSSPNAAQYRYKIASCASIGPIKFTARAHIADVEAGDVLAVQYPERTDISGHVMLVRTAPVADSALPAGPSGTTAFAVGIIDSTSDPHGTSTNYPDWRGGNTGQGLGTATYVLYADDNGTIVGSRWSATDPTVYDTTTHPLAIGGLL